MWVFGLQLVERERFELRHVALLERDPRRRRSPVTQVCVEFTMTPTDIRCGSLMHALIEVDAQVPLE